MNQKALQLFLSLCFVWLVTTQKLNLPQRYLPHADANITMFTRKGVLFFSMLIKDDSKVLIVSTTDYLFALDLFNISKVRTSTHWPTSAANHITCLNIGHPQIFCQNHIRVLQFTMSLKMYVCGTHAGKPRSSIVEFNKGAFKMEPDQSARGVCPYDPDRSFAFLVDGGEVFTASHVILSDVEYTFSHITRHNRLVTSKFKEDVFKDPKFVSMGKVDKSRFEKFKATGDPDEIYLFFEEAEVDVECSDAMRVSRVARVCKNDVGAPKEDNWASYLKAKINCPVLENDLPFLIQDAFLRCHRYNPWEECLIYATFTQQSDPRDFSGVCAYKVSEIDNLFATNDFRKKISHWAWDRIRHNLKIPPGACVNNALREQNINNSKELPDVTYNFVKEHFILHPIIEPIKKKPLLVHKGASFTRIVVGEVQIWNKDYRPVMFIATANGTVMKAIHSPHGSFIIEEVQVTQNPEAITSLQYGVKEELLFAITSTGVYQVSLANCERSKTCQDCILSRDPYCGWSADLKACVRSNKNLVIQGLDTGNINMCPSSVIADISVEVKVYSYIRLNCTPPFKHARLSWEKNEVKITSSSNMRLLEDGLLITNATKADTGVYRCVAFVNASSDQHGSVVRAYSIMVKECSNECFIELQIQSEKFLKKTLWLYAAVPILIGVSIGLIAHFVYQYFRSRPETSTEESPFQDSFSEMIHIDESPKSILSSRNSLKLDNISLTMDSSNTAKSPQLKKSDEK